MIFLLGQRQRTGWNIQDAGFAVLIGLKGISTRIRYDIAAVLLLGELQARVLRGQLEGNACKRFFALRVDFCDDKLQWKVFKPDHRGRFCGIVVAHGELNRLDLAKAGVVKLHERVFACGKQTDARFAIFTCLE